jgi:hypothetical protein
MEVVLCQLAIVIMCNQADWNSVGCSTVNLMQKDTYKAG